MIQRLLRNNFVRSGAVFSAASFVVSVIGYILNLLIARNFSLADYGEYITAVSYTILLGIPLSAFSMTIIKKIGEADKKDRVSLAVSIEKWMISELVSLSPIIAIIFVLLGMAMYFRGNMGLVAIIYILSAGLIGVFQSFYGSVLQSYKAFLAAGIFTIALFSIKMILVLGVIGLNPTLPLLFGAFVLASILGVLIGKKMMLQGEKKPKTFDNFNSFLSYLTKKSILIPLLTSLGIVALANTDVILVKKFFDSDVAGLYGSLSLLGRIILYVAAPLSAVAFSYFTGNDSKHQSIKILMLLTVVIGGLGFGASVFYALFPNLVVSIIFGDKFLAVSNLVWMAAVFGSLYSLMNLFAQYFVARGSSFAYLGLFAVVLQVIAIYSFHDSLEQVLYINIGVTAVLVLIYIAEVIRREYLYVSK